MENFPGGAGNFSIENFPRGVSVSYGRNIIHIAYNVLKLLFFFYIFFTVKTVPLSEKYDF